MNCGYGLRGTGSSLPPHIERINVPMFKNKTTRFQLDLKLTQSVRDELVGRGKLEITADSTGADAIMLGEILSFAAHPIGFGEDASADSYNIVITAKIVLRDLVNNRILFTNPYFTYQEEYEVPEGTDFETVQQEAIDRVALKFARTLIINILEGF
jgi:hypothetical protein